MSPPVPLVIPGDDEAAVGKRRNRRLSLIARRRGVDDELAANLAAVAMIHLGPGGFTAGVAARLALIFPGDHEIAVRQDGDLRPVLTSRNGRVDLEFRADLVVVGIENLGADLRTRCAGASFGVARIRPGNHIAAIGEGRNRREVLSAGLGRVRGELRADPGRVGKYVHLPGDRQRRRIRNRSHIDGHRCRAGMPVAVAQRIVELGDPAEVRGGHEGDVAIDHRDGAVAGIADGCHRQGGAGRVRAVGDQRGCRDHKRIVFVGRLELVDSRETVLPGSSTAISKILSTNRPP